MTTGKGGRPVGSAVYEQLRGDPAWWSHGACRDTDAAIWFPERYRHNGPLKGGRAPHGPTCTLCLARTICAGCPVLEECRAFVWNSETGSPQHRFGIYAGTTPRERIKAARDQRKSRSQARAATAPATASEIQSEAGIT